MCPYLTTTRQATYSPERRKWADAYEPAAIAVLASWLVQRADFQDDVDHATDLVVPAARISWRARRYDALHHWPEITIRQPELPKLAAPDGPDLLLCGWAAPEGPGFVAWVLVDAKKLGRWLLAHQDELRWRTNADGSTFTAVNPIRIGGCVLAAQQAEMAA